MKLSLLLILLCAGGQSVIAEAQNEGELAAEIASDKEIAKIHLTWFTRAGEGASSSIRLSQDGSFQSRHGGDIGNGSDRYTNVKGKVQGPELVAVFAKAYQVASLPPPKSHRQVMQGHTLSIEEVKGKVHTTNHTESGVAKELVDHIEQLLSSPMTVATLRIRPTAEHVVYEFQARAKCTAKQLARSSLRRQCAQAPSRFYLRTDGQWQCHQARPGRHGVEVFSTGGQGAHFPSKQWATQDTGSSTSLGRKDWAVQVRSTTGAVHLAAPKAAVKAWKRSAKKLSSLCWPK